MTDNSASPGSVPSHFPAHDGPRVWVISAGSSPIGISLARQLIAHGDIVVAGVPEFNPEREDPRCLQFKEFLNELSSHDLGWRERMKPVVMDIRSASPKDALEVEKELLPVIGTVEELSASPRTQMLVKDQFETNYFGPVNLIKATLPQFRRQKYGHVIVVGGITGHIGTPGLGVYCAAGWALEGFCDSLAYEIAPFNIRVTILQCSIEIGILTNLITSVPPIFPAYSPTTNHAPLFRNIMNGLLSRLPNLKQHRQRYSHSPSASASASGSAPASSSSPISPAPSTTAQHHANGKHRQQHTSEEADPEGVSNTPPLSAPTVVSLYPPLSAAHLDVLTAETIHAITAIGGHENPPARHIVGSEGVAAVKEKLKTVTEELEDFIECSSAVDINPVGGAEGFG
ncbi:hypothetical protein AJ79_05564 [Helicocarpus griseus UAMH5409]|uniref:Short chain dehydrogenase/reductase n=1 Tax=Helicocarpus griseus UAMH5409 TaxID=1447875 RepID=A0A2B7XMX4_9EURO|nr:hypothetical protein AJ79_05564 [Helicocarpus griseus UAMH5409]